MCRARSKTCLSKEAPTKNTVIRVYVSMGLVVAGEFYVGPKRQLPARMGRPIDTVDGAKLSDLE